MKFIFFLLPIVYGYMFCITPLTNKNLKFCVDCAEYFVENKCLLFYNLDIITRRKNFYNCNMARINYSFCGENAKFFNYNGSSENVEPCSNN